MLVGYRQHSREKFGLTFTQTLEKPHRSAPVTIQEDAQVQQESKEPSICPSLVKFKDERLYENYSSAIASVGGEKGIMNLLRNIAIMIEQREKRNGYAKIRAKQAFEQAAKGTLSVQCESHSTRTKSSQHGSIPDCPAFAFVRLDKRTGLSFVKLCFPHIADGSGICIFRPQLFTADRSIDLH